MAYWKEHSTEATVETMMLDTKAQLLDASERPEIMGAQRDADPPALCLTLPRPPAALLPPSLEGLRVLELGAGIGRFTGLLAQRNAVHVHAVDFMQNLIQEVRAFPAASRHVRGDARAHAHVHGQRSCSMLLCLHSFH